jgi:4-diphosphocytidyl-2-C-methyl-D-erythritol kinase
LDGAAKPVNTPLLLTLPSPAKLNLFLHITGRRADGYHNLQTVFQLLNWGDTLCFETTRDDKITVLMGSLNIPDQQNLIVLAAQQLLKYRKHSNSGVTITVDKKIPTGGGLGGGSSNAATTLLALNRLWALCLSPETLLEIGATLGADVPVFIAGNSAWAEGIGEQLTPLKLPPAWFLIVKPPVHVSTAEIFSHEQLTRDTSPITLAAFFEGSSRNDCQPIVESLHSDVTKVLNWLDIFGEAKLTGTGACAFVSFKTQAEAEAAKQQLPTKWTGYVAEGLNQSPVISALS